MTLRLDRLFSGNQKNIQTLWQRHCEAIETAFNDLQGQVAAIAAAQAAATAAQATADAVKVTDKLTASYVIPAAVLAAADVGTTATITIDNHVRRYGDGSDLSITGGTLTGLTFATDYAVYYDDATFSDTTPTSAYTTTPSNALNNFAPGRHYVGLITTPADGAAGTSGGSNPPGSGGDTFWNRFDT
jgi:hypothetical protein